jgi:hypothetical protein
MERMEKNAPTEAVGCTINAGQEGIIPDKER